MAQAKQRAWSFLNSLFSRHRVAPIDIGVDVDLDMSDINTPQNTRRFSVAFLPRPIIESLNTMQMRIAVGAVAVVGALIVAFVMIRPDSEIGSAALLGGMLVLAGLVMYDIISRRNWERTITEQLESLTRNHDRLVREVARNRTDLAVVKEGLADAADEVMAIGKNFGPGHTIEAKMIETIITQLSELGRRPSTRILSPQEQAALNAQAEDPAMGILELLVAPPPKMVPPPSALEAALNPDFNKFSDTVVMELNRHAVQNDHIDVFVQPVVSLPQRKARFQELYARLRAAAGSYIPAARYMDLAHKESMVPAIDNLLLLRALQILRDQRDDDDALPSIINISSATLHDTSFMNDLVTFLAQYRTLAPRIVFELPLGDIDNAPKSVTEILSGLSQLGCRFSVDQVRRRRIDINRLRSMGIRFIKLDAAWLIREAQQDGGNARITKLKAQLDRAGIDLIVERVENANQLREVLDFGIDYGQGFLFAKPDLYGSTGHKSAINPKRAVN